MFNEIYIITLDFICNTLTYRYLTISIIYVNCLLAHNSPIYVFFCNIQTAISFLQDVFNLLLLIHFYNDTLVY